MVGKRTADGGDLHAPPACPRERLFLFLSFHHKAEPAVAFFHGCCSKQRSRRRRRRRRRHRQIYDQESLLAHTYERGKPGINKVGFFPSLSNGTVFSTTFRLSRTPSLGIYRYVGTVGEKNPRCCFFFHLHQLYLPLFFFDLFCSSSSSSFRRSNQSSPLLPSLSSSVGRSIPWHASG